MKRSVLVAIALLVFVVAACGKQTTAGGGNCGPQTMPGGPGTAQAEVHGISAFGDAWLLLPDRTYPARSGVPLDVAFKLTEAKVAQVNARLFEGASPGVPGEIGPITPHSTPEWQRPGSEWATTIKFHRTGCWVLRIFAGEVEGSFTFRVN